MLAPVASPVSAAVKASSSASASTPIRLASSTTMATGAPAAARSASRRRNTAKRCIVPLAWALTPNPASSRCRTSSGASCMRPIQAAMRFGVIVSSARLTIEVLPTPTGPATVTTASSAVRPFFTLVMVSTWRGPLKMPAPSALEPNGRDVRPKCTSYMTNPIAKIQGPHAQMRGHRRSVQGLRQHFAGLCHKTGRKWPYSGHWGGITALSADSGRQRSDSRFRRHPRRPR